MPTNNNILKTKLLLTIVNKEKELEIAKIYDHNDVLFHFSVQAEGLASSDILKYWGLDEIKKKVIFSIISENREQSIFHDLKNKVKINKRGNGIAFTIPFTSASVHFANEEVEKKEEIVMTNINKYELILIILTDGYADQVMDLARTLGATGGTLIHGKGLGAVEATKFLGVTIQPEKDIILILTEANNKHKIMEAIVEEFGLTSKGKGICFSLPVDSVVGIEERSL